MKARRIKIFLNFSKPLEISWQETEKHHLVVSTAFRYLLVSTEGQIVHHPTTSKKVIPP